MFSDKSSNIHLHRHINLDSYKLAFTLTFTHIYVIELTLAYTHNSLHTLVYTYWLTLTPA